MQDKQYEKMSVKSEMWYALHLNGVWCRGCKARCYMGDEDACKKCKYYNKKGVN